VQGGMHVGLADAAQQHVPLQEIRIPWRTP
jgi:hypothetical protein